MDNQKRPGRDVIECPACQRKTPAARATCFYCGADLPVERIEVAPPQAALEHFEAAFNTIVRVPASADPQRLALSLVSALAIDIEEASALATPNDWLPIARSATQREAELVAGLAADCGMEARVVADEALRLTEEPARARGAKIEGGELRVQLSGRELHMPVEDLRLLVIGTIRTQRVDFVETASGLRGKGASVIDSAEFVSEETLLDIYTEDVAQSFRIRAEGFDYSGLVQPLSWRAALNFRAAIDALLKAAPNARLDQAYDRLRPLLQRAWPERTRTESRGVARQGLTMRPVSRASALRDNRDQFTRYSRLRWKMGTEI